MNKVKYTWTQDKNENPAQNFKVKNHDRNKARQVKTF